MKKATVLLKNTILLATSNIILRLLALLLQSFLAGKIGAENLGLFGIISSLGVVFATISISGVRFGTTRLVSEEEGRGNKNPHSLMRCAFVYSLIFGFASGGVLYSAANIFSRYWVMNVSASTALRIIAISMPFVAFGSVIEGYFTAKQKIFRLVTMQIIAQLLRIIFVVSCFSRPANRNIIDTLSLGMLIGEVSLTIGGILLYFIDTAGKKEENPQKGNFVRLIKTSLPLAISAYMRTGLSSLGQIIIPHGLKKGGMGSKSAFATYGVVSQMSMPVIMFPAALLNALGEVLIPRLTAAQIQGRKIGISYIVNRALRLGVIFSFGVAGVMFFYSQPLGRTIYKSIEAGEYIRIFAPLVPIVYIDCVTDGCLKGLNQQVYSMVYNVLEGVINVVLLFLLLPKTAIMGYVMVMYIKELFNAVLSIRRLRKVTQVDVMSWGMTSSVISLWGAKVLCDTMRLSAPLGIIILVYISFYVTLLYILSAVSREDIRWVFSLIKADNEEKAPKKPIIGVDKTVVSR